MDQQKIQTFMISNQKNFEASQIPTITEKLQQADDEQLMILSSAKYKDPTTMLIISLLLGGLGVDRFLLGETGMGVLKLLTGGCLGILTIIDWLHVMDKTRQKNMEIFMEALRMKNTFSAFAKPQQNKNDDSKVETIKKYKQLLDADIITQEEFEKKKKEILQ